MPLEHRIGDERPTWKMWCVGSTGTLMDLSTGTFVGRIYTGGSRAPVFVATLTGTFAGAVGAGTEPDGTPNLVYTPATNEFSASILVSGRYSLRVIRTASTLDETVFDGPITILVAVPSS